MKNILLALAFFLGSFSAFAAPEVDLTRLMYCQANAEIILNQASKLRDGGKSYDEAVALVQSVVKENGLDEDTLKLTIGMLNYVYSSKDEPMDTAIGWFNECLGNPKI